MRIGTRRNSISVSEIAGAAGSWMRSTASVLVGGVATYINELNSECSMELTIVFIRFGFPQSSLLHGGRFKADSK